MGSPARAPRTHRRAGGPLLRTTSRTTWRTVLLASAVAAALLTPTAAHAEPRAEPRAGAGATGGSRIPALTDEHGRALTLRGWNVEDKANRGDAALSAVTEKHFRDMRAKGFGFARLLVFWDDLEPRPSQYSQAYLRKVERILDWAEKYDVKVLLDAHQDVFGPAFGHRGIPAWATRTDGLPFTPRPDDWFSEYFEPAVQRAFTHLYEDEDLRRAQARMWRVLAGRFDDHPAVLGYDLINEPMGEVREGEDLVTAARRIERDQLTPLYNRLADAVRAVDRDAWIFVEPTPSWARACHRARADPRPEGRLRPALLQHRHGGGRRLRPRRRLDRDLRAGRHPLPRAVQGARGGGGVGAAQQLPAEHEPLLP